MMRTPVLPFQLLHKRLSNLFSHRLYFLIPAQKNAMIASLFIKAKPGISQVERTIQKMDQIYKYLSFTLVCSCYLTVFCYHSIHLCPGLQSTFFCQPQKLPNLCYFLFESLCGFVFYFSFIYLFLFSLPLLSTCKFVIFIMAKGAHLYWSQRLRSTGRGQGEEAKLN